MDLPVNEDISPPSCCIDERFLRDLFSSFNISNNRNAVIIKTEIKSDGHPHSFAFIKFESHEEAM